MNTISTSKARSMLPALINQLHEHRGAFVIGRRNNPEAILIPFPKLYRKDVSDSTLVNAQSASFDFLDAEPELYSVADIRSS